MKATISLDGRGFTQGISSMRAQLRDLGGSMKSIGRSLSTYVTAPLLGLGAIALKTSGDFQAGMNRVAAISGATGSQLEALRDAASEMGKTTQFSASEAADALGFLAMAGYDADKAIASLPHTLTLAASAGVDLASSADIVSNVLSGYGMGVDQLAHSSDVLVKTITSSNTSLLQLGEAMVEAAPIASSAGVSFEEASAALGLFGNAGLQGSKAGTTLKNAISKMLSPTDAMKSKLDALGISFVDATGRLLPLDNIIDQLAPHAKDTALMLEIFGQRAGPGMAALVGQGSDALRDLTSELRNSTGEAARVASANMQGFNGSLKELKSALEGLMIAIGDSGILEFATDFIHGLKDMVLSLSEVNPKILKFGTVIAGLAAIVGPLILTLGAFSAAIGAISAPVLLVVGGIAALTAGAIALTGVLGGASGASNTLTEAEMALKEALSGVNRASAQSIEAGRAVAEQHQKTAKAAVTAARAELALAQARADSEMADLESQGFEHMNPMAQGFATRPMEIDLEGAQADLAEAEKALAGIEAQILSLDVSAALVANPVAPIVESTPEIEEAGQSLSGLSEQVTKLLDSLEPALTAEDKMTQSVTLLDEALQAGLITQEQYNLAVDQLSEKLNSGSGPSAGLSKMAETAKGVSEKLKGLGDSTLSFSEQVGKTVGENLAGSFDDFVMGAKSGSEALSDLLGALRKMALNNIFKMLAKSFGGGGGFLGSLFGGLSGARANGGPVTAGGSYLVGENGPEIYTPSVSGQIIPNHEIHSAPASSGEGQAPQILNVLDPSIVGDYLDTSAGARVIMNVIRKNGGLSSA